MAINKDVMIGLEVHAYLNTKEKLFCRCKTEHKSKEVRPNTLVCPICTGQPGCKPMLPNSEALRKLIQISLMLNAHINTIEKGKKVVWQRKHYDWPDLPKGYQETISGARSIPVSENGRFRDIRIREIHLEEDPAAWNPETGCIDYNRSGLPLAEIVTEPDFSDTEEVEGWIKHLVLVLAYIKAVDKNAGIKIDLNVSMGGGERVEIKNMNSIENIKKAIDYEIIRQRKERAKRETRRYDEKKGITIRMREKEQTEDYRFIIEPDLPVINIKEKQVREIKNKLPESPEKKLEKLIKKYKIDKENASILYKNLALVEFFEKISKKVKPRFALPWIAIELLRVLNYNKKALDETDIKVEHFAELIQLVETKKITELKAKRILNEFIPKSFSPKTKLKGQERITNKKQIEKICKQVMDKNKQAVSDFKQGKKEAFNFLMGEVMKLSERRADYVVARKIMESLLK